MCGIAGELRIGRGGDTRIRAVLDRLAHRGPDDSVVWSDDAAGVTLGHARLAVLDLTPSGRQPMTSASGRFTLTYNGELYNHLELRAALAESGQAPAWRGSSDTETLLAGIEAWGLVATLTRSRGMFALALWDASTRTLALARDRFGEKPLCYARTAQGIVFASELRALRAHPAVATTVDRDALARYVRVGYVPAPQTILSGVHKLPPGTVLTIDESNTAADPVVWYDRAAVILEHAAAPSAAPFSANVATLDALLTAAVREQSVADVPVGALLSGGVDSTAIVLAMVRAGVGTVRTFTVGFDEAQYDESAGARAVATHLGTAHSALIVRGADALAVVPRLATIADEPFADSSLIPTFLISQLARTQVTVALSGDAGDELFGGYVRHVMAAGAWEKLRLLPTPVRRALAALAPAGHSAAWDRFLGVLQRGRRADRQLARPGEKWRKAIAALGATSPHALQQGLLALWPSPTRVVLGTAAPSLDGSDVARRLAALPAAEQVMALDLLTYLPGDLLVKVDRAAMAVSLETRVPFLDPRLVAFAWGLPRSHRIDDGVGKRVLRAYVGQHLPASVVARPKMGFAVPLAGWLRGPLREWGAALLDPARLRHEGYFDAAVVQTLWQRHLSAADDAAARLWPLLVFQAWREHDAS